MPMIVTVALSIGVRRVLSDENIYTIKLVGRGHFIPKAMHANMFLVRRAADVMETDFELLAGSFSLDEYLHGAAPIVDMSPLCSRSIIICIMSMRIGLAAVCRGCHAARIVECASAAAALPYARVDNPTSIRSVTA